MCDLVVHEKKISGNGGGEIGECKVLGGNILLGFDYECMAQSVLLPMSVRGRFFELMHNKITTVEKELGINPSKKEICSILATKFVDFLGPMTKGKVEIGITKKMTELDKQYSSDTWLYQRGTKQIGREIKICEGTFLFYKAFDTKKGPIEIICEIEDKKVKKVIFSGSLSPSQINQKERSLIGMEYERDKLVNEIINKIKIHGGVVVA